MAERLDVRLAAQYGVTRSRAGELIRQGRARVDGVVRTKPGFDVSGCDAMELDIPDAIETTVAAEAIPLEILYEDQWLAVVVKPCGMVVHPAAGNETGTLVNALLHHLTGLSGIGGEKRPGIVHRLDKDTSGLLLVAKTDAAHVALSNALKAREIHKTYRALAAGAFRDDSGFIEAPIGRSPKNRKKMAVVKEGRYARTEYRAIEALRGATLLELDLITGRTHQIRVHLASIGHPILGDAVYGSKQSAGRLMLHAWRLSFSHPITGEPMRFTAPEPPEFTREIEKLSGK